MNWEAIGAIGEVVGAAGVVATLLYLAVQVRLSRRATDANTQVNRAASAALSQDANAGLNQLLASNSSLSKLLSHAMEQGSFDGLSPDEVLRLRMFMRAGVQIMEATYFRYEEGLLDPRIWALRRDWTKSFIQTAPVSDWWAAERESSCFTNEFIAEIEGAEGFALSGFGQRVVSE
jgi:hypothetical protein